MHASVRRGRDSTGVPVTDRRGRAIGRILGRDYHKFVTRPDQMLRSPPGFGFDAWAMDRLVLPRVDRIVVTCRFDGKVYTAPVETFRRYSLAIDRGAGRQYVLPLSYWQEEGTTEGAPTPRALVSSPPAPRRPEEGGPGQRERGDGSAPGSASAPPPPLQGRLL